MDKGMVVFVVLIILIVAAGVVLGNTDVITPVMAHSKADLAIGSTWTNGINMAMNWIVKFAVGGIFTGFGVAAFNEVRKAYKLWKRNSQAGRWQSGPNAMWQQKQSTGPRLTKNDLMFMALLGRVPKKPSLSSRIIRKQDDEEELDIEL